MTAFEENIAIAYLHEAEDKENKCILTSQRLVVVYKGKVFSFDKEHIKALSFGQRRIMLPLVSGGIMAPLSLLAIFLNLYNPWPLMFVFFLGSALLYLGWQQHPVLVVRDSVKDHDFFLNDISPNLKAFLSFARQYVFQGGNELYLVLPLQEWEQTEQQDNIATQDLYDKGYVRLLSPAQLARWKKQKHHRQHNFSVLHINPLQVKAEIRYEPGERGAPELYAHVYGSINREAIIKTELF
ncbi:DUF952 domain-containing protein [Porifericola rhodea]|uniref:DUF952 domain-containing protein n=1 Tax=Porifericola rhodea TaxID=930972 RepID=UPI00266552B4|nr:DUF952 domain-containing protein [Porifericola rhodea]WKN33265.1 DUF952 domain-containing protein [Porifericola rhodea]